MLTETHHRALAVIAGRLAGQGVVWAITGSTAFALQGLPVVAHDIDLQTDEAGAYECDRLLAEFRVRPVAFSQVERLRSHFGTFRIEGVDVEVMGDIEKRGEGGEWAAPAHLPSLVHWHHWGALCLPVLPLAYEAAAYRAMGRLERAALIDHWLTDAEGT